MSRHMLSFRTQCVIAILVLVGLSCVSRRPCSDAPVEMEHLELIYESQLLEGVLDVLFSDEELWQIRRRTFSMGRSAVDLETYRAATLEQIQVPGKDLRPVLDALIAVNHESHVLALPSRPDKGYEFEGDAGTELRKEAIARGQKPGVGKAISGSAVVSLPVYDASLKVVIVLVDRVKGPWAAREEVVVFSSEDGVLRELGRALITIA